MHLDFVVVIPFITSTASFGIVAFVPPCHHRAIVTTDSSSFGTGGIAKTIGTTDTISSSLAFKEELQRLVLGVVVP